MFSRHRKIMSINEFKPSIDYSWVAPNSSLIGEVYVNPYASIWYNAVVRAEKEAVRIGSYSSIGDSTLIFTYTSTPPGVPGSVTIGKHVTIQNGCTIYSSIIDDEVFIGSNSIIGEGCKIEKGAVIAPNSFVPHGRLIPGRQLWGGNPVKYIRDLTDQEVYSNYIQSFNIWNLAQSHLSDFNMEKKDGEIEVDPNSLVSSYLTENYFEWRSRYYD